ncbi:MAG: VanW family protein [Eggerthellaceae bacterium]|nr:VanW family protein [Eggerthellaceae bacterium]
MAGSASANRSRRTTEQSSPMVLPVILFCSIAISACVAFGNPALWTFVLEPEPDRILTPDEEIIYLLFHSGNELTNDKDLVIISQSRTMSQSEDLDRAKNLSLAVAAINLREIKPGETFSFNQAVGDTENNSEYRIAPVVFGNDMTYARGGGICQVSTALYIAALEANLEIVERHAHSIVTDYSPLGLDSTLVYGVMDLRLRNTGDHPVYIYAEAVGQVVNVKIIGHALQEGISIEAVGRMVDRYPKEGSSGSGSVPFMYVVDSYRIYYQNGVKVGQEFLSTDIYEASSDSQIIIGEGNFNPTK